MSNIFVIGATGGIGSRLIPMLLENGHSVTALYRKSEQASELTAKGVRPYQNDLMSMSEADFAEAIRGHDAVVFSAGAAGSGPDRTQAIDGEAPPKLVAAAEKEGVSRLYLVSAFMDSGRDRPRSDGFELYMRMKRKADCAVTQSKLDWVIVRPGTLVSEEGDGKVNAGHAIEYGPVARGNVAQCLNELINRPNIKHEIIELTNGSVPVKDAIARFER